VRLTRGNLVALADHAALCNAAAVRIAASRFFRQYSSFRRARMWAGVRSRRGPAGGRGRARTTTPAASAVSTRAATGGAVLDPLPNFRAAAFLNGLLGEGAVDFAIALLDSASVQM
jgi:hypothetical protein